MPVDDAEQPVWLKNCPYGTCKTNLIRNTVEGIGDQDKVDQVVKAFGKRGGVCTNPLANGCSSSFNFALRQLDHGGIEIKGHHISINERCEWAGEVAIAATKVENAHALPDANLLK